MNRRSFLRYTITTSAALWAGLPVLRVMGVDTQSAKPLRILFFSDVHAMEEHNAPELLMETAHRLADLPFDLVIGGGDFVHGGFRSTAASMESRFAVCKRFLDALGHPVEAILGNHDMVGASPEDGTEPDPDPTRLFRDLTGVKNFWRTFDVGGRRFFILSSVEPFEGPGGYRGWISEDQRVWLQACLAQTPSDMPLVLCTHIPFRTTFKQIQESPGAPLPQNLVVGNANDILSLFGNHHLELVLQGHLHINEWIRSNQTTFLMGGAVSGSWWQGANLGTPPGFGVIELGATKDNPRWVYHATG